MGLAGRLWIPFKTEHFVNVFLLFSPVLESADVSREVIAILHVKLIAECPESVMDLLLLTALISHSFQEHIC